MQTARSEQQADRDQRCNLEHVQRAVKKAEQIRIRKEQKMNEIYIAVLALSIINVVIAIINVITNGRLSRVYDEYEIIRDELKSTEDKLSEVYERFDGESDVICRMVDAHRILKRDHEKDHLLTMTMYNDFMASKENWKQIKKYMEENDNDDKAVS